MPVQLYTVNIYGSEMVPIQTTLANEIKMIVIKFLKHSVLFLYLDFASVALLWISKI